MSTTAYTITSAKGTFRVICTLEQAIERAKAHNDQCQPAFGTEIECDTKTVWSSDWNEYRYATDGDSGTIYAEDFDAACEQLDAMFTPQILADGGTGWVEDGDGERYTIGR